MCTDTYLEEHPCDVPYTLGEDGRCSLLISEHIRLNGNSRGIFMAYSAWVILVVTTLTLQRLHFLAYGSLMGRRHRGIDLVCQPQFYGVLFQLYGTAMVALHAVDVHGYGGRLPFQVAVVAQDQATAGMLVAFVVMLSTWYMALGDPAHVHQRRQKVRYARWGLVIVVAVSHTIVPVLSPILRPPDAALGVVEGRIRCFGEFIVYLYTAGFVVLFGTDYLRLRRLRRLRKSGVHSQPKRPSTHDTSSNPKRSSARVHPKGSHSSLAEEGPPPLAPRLSHASVAHDLTPLSTPRKKAQTLAPILIGSGSIGMGEQTAHSQKQPLKSSVEKGGTGKAPLGFSATRRWASAKELGTCPSSLQDPARGWPPTAPGEARPDAGRGAGTVAPPIANPEHSRRLRRKTRWEMRTTQIRPPSRTDSTATAPQPQLPAGTTPSDAAMHQLLKATLLTLVCMLSGLLLLVNLIAKSFQDCWIWDEIPDHQYYDFAVCQQLCGLLILVMIPMRTHFFCRRIIDDAEGA